MKKIVYVPLDERPCNYQYPLDLAEMTDLRLTAPELGKLGDKKNPADTRGVAEWLRRESEDADYALVSIDMLVYGGIVPSRLHEWTPGQCVERLETLRSMKKTRPGLRIIAFNLIMRAPAYSSSEEEPDYYADYGRDLYDYGRLGDKAEREGLTDFENQERETVQDRIPGVILNDFLSRRRTNGIINEQAIDLAHEGIIDFLIIPLDDNSKYGYTSADQRRLAAKVEQLDLYDRVHIYPGADEIGCTLFARIFSEIKSFTPQFRLRYSSTNGPFCIPKYEDRTLNESIKYHITAAGGIIADSAETPDVFLMVHSPAASQTDMAETTDRYDQRHRSYFSEINIREFVQFIRHIASSDRLIALADVSLCNGGDHSLMRMLSNSGLLGAISCYAAWNTSGNSLGTVVSHAVIEAYNRTQPDLTVTASAMEKSRTYYAYRLLEDWGYQAVVREDICKNELPALGAEYFRLSHVQEEIEAIIGTKLELFSEKYLSELGDMRVYDVRLPWYRMFEVGFRLSLNRKESRI
ncbi:DUF4127 family protein [Cohnella silvisoli]|uniref:DUF4127 family protein n=1 Tax=Cohnella silvisoli TaxID=2873699 RepID=A0ABV1KRP3_9BACL|nr:DUF4127 family protein [Cohnella silvisoli]MCD9022392.1 DUF4127 family protein [Cohnella silvisoli]